MDFLAVLATWAIVSSLERHSTVKLGNKELFGCFGDMGNCKFNGETQYCNFAKPYTPCPILMQF